MKVNRNNTYNNKIIYIDGYPGSGKVLVSSILECFENVEMRIEDEQVYLIDEANRIGKLQEDMAIVMLQTVLDRRMHYLMLSRGINIKFGEILSVLKYPNPLKYIKRYFITERDKVDNLILMEKPVFQNMTQNIMNHVDLHFKAFGDRLKVIYVERNPIDVIFDLYNRDFVNRIGKKPSNIRYTNENGIPTFAIDWDTEYTSLNDMEKVVKWIYEMTKSNISCKEKRVKVVHFDELVTNPYKSIEEIENFLCMKHTNKIYRRLRKEKCPRTIDLNERKEKERFIRKKISARYNKMLDDLIYFMRIE